MTFGLPKYIRGNNCICTVVVAAHLLELPQIDMSFFNRNENPWLLKLLGGKIKNQWIIHIVFVPDKIIMFRKEEKLISLTR